MSHLSITDSKRLDILTQYNGRCAYCGQWAPLTIDHRTPRCRGGNATYENLAPACEDCNSCKDSMTVEEFRKEVGVRKAMSALNEQLKQPFTRLFPWKWYRTLKRFTIPVTFWLDKH